jgi:hypothetical protein
VPAAFFESRRVASMMGATTQFEKKEGLTYSPVTNKVSPQPHPGSAQDGGRRWGVCVCGGGNRSGVLLRAGAPPSLFSVLWPPFLGA